jgi:hypothetical protein
MLIAHRLTSSLLAASLAFGVTACGGVRYIVRIVLVFVLALAYNSVYADEAPQYTQAQIDAAWNAQVAFAKSMSEAAAKRASGPPETPETPETPEEKRLNRERLLEILRNIPDAPVTDDFEAQRQQRADDFEAQRQRIINYRPHGNSIPATPAQAKFENELADSLDVPREQLAAMYAADRATLQESQALLKQVQQQAAESAQRVADQRAAEEARRQRAAEDSAYSARREQDRSTAWAQVQRNQANLDAYVASRAAVSEGIVSNAMARTAYDTARTTALAPTTAPAPPKPAPMVDPLAPNSALQAEAARARKGAGSDLCPNSISDIECANRLQWLQEQARGQH